MGGILSNCGGVTGPLTNTFEQSVAVGNTWSVGADLGIDFGPLKIGGNYDWSTTETVTISQTIEFQVQPGEMVCVTPQSALFRLDPEALILLLRYFRVSWLRS
jgi:hypothetical protein